MASDFGFTRRGTVYLAENPDAVAVVGIRRGKRGLDLAVRGGITYKKWGEVLGRHQRDPLDEADRILEILHTNKFGGVAEARWTVADWQRSPNAVAVQVAEGARRDLFEPAVAWMAPGRDEADLFTTWRDTGGELPAGDALGRLYLWLCTSGKDDDAREGVRRTLIATSEGASLARRIER